MSAVPGLSAVPRCVVPGCGHSIDLHEWDSKRKTRKGCSAGSGPSGRPCGCTQYLPAAEVTE